MKFQKNPVYGFTRKFGGIARALVTQIFVSEAYAPASGVAEPTRKEFQAIWDTGATGTVIGANIVNALGLKPTGKTVVQAVGEGGKVNEYIANTYLVNIFLPNNVMIVGAVVVEGGIGGADALIGMDIISSGDLAITNCDGETYMSFRTPSVERIDFVQDIAEYNRRYGHVNLSEEEKRKARNKRKAENRRNR